MHYFWVIVAITLSAAGAFFVVPFTKNTIGGEAKTSNVVEADRLAMEKEEEVVKGAGESDTEKWRITKRVTREIKVYLLFGFHGA